MVSPPHRTIEWRPRTGGALSLQLHGPEETAAAPVLFLGGLGLGPQWSFYPYLVEQLARDRPVVVPAAPEPYRLSAERAAADDLLRALGAGERPPGMDWSFEGPVGIVGHAKGASLALLVASRHEHVRAVVAIAPLCSFQRLIEDDDLLQRDMLEHSEEFLLEVAARGLRSHVVLIAGEEDHVVPIVEAETLFHWMPKEAASLVLLEKTGHSLGAQHPFEGSNRELDRVVHIARELFDRELGAPHRRKTP